MDPSRPFDARAYWRRTLRRILLLLAVWALVGPVMGILLVEPLNAYTLGGVPFGFWMAQQGSIYVFVVLIFLNAWLSDRADREFGVEETPSTTQHTTAAPH
jgi:putative solute:sodium symporter small subunit